MRSTGTRTRVSQWAQTTWRDVDMETPAQTNWTVAWGRTAPRARADRPRALACRAAATIMGHGASIRTMVDFLDAHEVPRLLRSDGRAAHGDRGAGQARVSAARAQIPPGRKQGA